MTWWFTAEAGSHRPRAGEPLGTQSGPSTRILGFVNKSLQAGEASGDKGNKNRTQKLALISNGRPALVSMAFLQARKLEFPSCKEPSCPQGPWQPREASPRWHLHGDGDGSGNYGSLAGRALLLWEAIGLEQGRPASIQQAPSTPCLLGARTVRHL